MKRLLLGLIAAIVLATTHAFAADLWAPPPMPYKAPPPPPTPAWDWTGFYLGIDVGAAWATDTVSPTVADPTGPTGTFPRSNKLSTSGPLGGATIGFNYQLSSFVFGIEGDIGALALANSVADSGSGSLVEIDSINNGWYGDATGRLGFAFGPALIYGKGGWAYFGGQGSTTTGAPGYSVTQTGSFTGWTYGGGLEYRLGGPWSAKIEYLHFAFGTKDASLTAVTAAPVGTVYPYANALSVDTVKFGLNYKFGMGPRAPLYPSGPIFTRD
jgi:outer membrane immunogenic protein